MKTIRLLMAGLILAGFSTATLAARSGVPVENHENVEIPRSGDKAVGEDDVKRAIVTAAKSRGWETTVQAPGRLQLDLDIRGKHRATVEVRYDTKVYSIRYLNSVNLRYKDGMIHPEYNKQVGALLRTINTELLKI